MGKLVIDEKTLLPKNLDDKTRTSIVKSMYELDEADRAADEKCGASEELHKLIEQEKVMGFAYLDRDFKTVVDMYDELYTGFVNLLHKVSYSSTSFVLREMHNIRTIYAVSRVMVNTAE